MNMKVKMDKYFSTDW